MACKSIKPNTNRICVADLKDRIKIQRTYSAGNNNPDTNASTSFVDLGSFWSLVKTSPSANFVDGVNISNSINTDFYIRYTTSIDFDDIIWIEFRNRRFKMLN